MVCGPLTQSIYDMAYDELLEGMGTVENQVPLEKLPRDICIDRLALKVMRTQVQLLLDTISNRDAEVELTRSAFESFRLSTVDEQQQTLQRHQSQIEDLRQQIRQLKNANIQLQTEVRSTQSDKERGRSKRAVANGKAAAGTGSAEKDELDEIPKFSPREKPLISPRSQSAFVKVQAMTKGYLTRLQVNSARVHHAAANSGVLVAVKGTNQGNCNYSELIEIFILQCFSCDVIMMYDIAIRRREWMV